MGCGGTIDRGIRSQVGNRGKIGWNQSLIYMHPFPPLLPQFFYLPLFNSVVKKKKGRVQKTFFLGRGAFAQPLLPPPQVTPMPIRQESDSSTSKDFLQHLKGHRLFYNSILWHLFAVRQWMTAVQSVLAKKKNKILEIFISNHNLSLFFKIFIAENACAQMRLVANWHSYTARNFPSYKNLLKARCDKIQSFISPLVP